MINPLIHYEVEMAIREQAQLQRQISLGSLTNQAAAVTKHRPGPSAFHWSRLEINGWRARLHKAFNGGTPPQSFPARTKA
jgi:hypothetical protein